MRTDDANCAVGSRLVFMALAILRMATCVGVPGKRPVAASLTRICRFRHLPGQHKLADRLFAASVASQYCREDALLRSSLLSRLGRTQPL